MDGYFLPSRRRVRPLYLVTEGISNGYPGRLHEKCLTLLAGISILVLNKHLLLVERNFLQVLISNFEDPTA